MGAFDEAYSILAQRAAEEEARRRKEAELSKFNLGALLPSLVAAPFTGGASLVSMGIPSALGEAVRAGTKSELPLGEMASAAYNMFAPTQPLESPIPKGIVRGVPGEQVPQPNILEQAGKWIQERAYKPETTEEKGVRAVIESGKMSPYSAKYRGVDYKRPEESWEQKVARAIKVKQTPAAPAAPGAGKEPLTARESQLAVAIAAGMQEGIKQEELVTEARSRGFTLKEYQRAYKEVASKTSTKLPKGRPVIEFK